MEPDYLATMKGTIMFKEINFSPEAVRKTLESVRQECSYASELLKTSKYVFIVGSGTSFHAGMVLQIGLLKRGIPAVTVKAPEFSHYLPENKNSEVTVILISQSGESRDILDSLYAAKDKGFSTVCITNTRDSSLSVGSDISIVTEAGLERALAATKTFISALAAVDLIIEELDGKSPEGLNQLPTNLKDYLDHGTEIALRLAATVKDKVVVLGNGNLHALALEGALKFKETATIETEAYPVREYLHGPIQSLNGDATLILLHRPEEEVEAVMEQIKKQTGSIIRIGFGESDEIQLETVPDNQIPALFALPLQLMANYKSVSLGRDPDHPQHLTKVVK